MIHSIKAKNLDVMLLKIDLVKAYDRVKLDFLRLILLQIGLPLSITNWNTTCISSENLVVLVNGSPIGFFKSTRGLR